MKVISFNAPFAPFATTEAQERFISSQVSRFGLSAGDIKSCSYCDGDYLVYIRTDKKSAIDSVINQVYGTSKKKYLGLNLVHFWGETSIIIK